MTDLFTNIPLLDSKSHTDYFLNEFIPKFNAESVLASSRLVQYGLKDSYMLKDPGIQKLNADLNSIGLPNIKYFMIFKHNTDQSAHIDGSLLHSESPYMGINLPLSGYENTNLIFYKILEGAVPSKRRTGWFVYDSSQLDEIGSIPGANEWALVNTAAYHRLANVSEGIPRYTLTLRLEGNPSYAKLRNTILRIE